MAKAKQSAAERLAQKLNDLNDKTGGGGLNLQVPEEPMKIRMVPYPHDEHNLPFFDCYYHYRIGKNRSLVCPLETYGDPCPICELAEDFKERGDKESWGIFRKIQAKVRTYSPVVVRGSEVETGVKLWGYGPTACKDLISKEQDSDWGSLFDIMDGHDISVKKIPKHTGSNDSDFDIVEHDVKPLRTNLVEAVGKKKLAELLKSIPNYLDSDIKQFQAKTYEELMAIVKAFGGVEDDDDDDSDGTSYSGVVEDDEDDDDTPKETKKEALDAALDDLLKEDD